MTRRLLCIVEGHGEVQAIPNLCERIRIDLLQAWDWFVDPEPFRQPRGSLVDERVASPARPVRSDRLERVLHTARRSRDAHALLVICDADDDCPAAWGPGARALVEEAIPGDAVMVVREFETWMVCALPADELRALGFTSPAAVERRRDAKSLMRRRIPGYRPTTHQLAATRAIDLTRLWQVSDSFDKLVRCLARIFGHPCPQRPASE